MAEKKSELWRDKRYKHFGQMVDEVIALHNRRKGAEDPVLTWNALGRLSRMTSAHMTNLRHNIARRDETGKKYPFKRIPLPTIEAIADALNADPPLRQWFRAARNVDSEDDYKLKQFDIEALLRRTGVLGPARGRARSLPESTSSKAMVRRSRQQHVDAEPVETTLEGQPGALHIQGLTFQTTTQQIDIQGVTIRGYHLDKLLVGLLTGQNIE